MKIIRTGRSIKDVRDPAFAEVDDKRAAEVLDRLISVAQGHSDREAFTSAEASDIVAMIESQRYLKMIQRRIP